MPQDYTELGALMIAATVIGFLLPILAVWAVKALRLRTA
jgi:hypothetical protein